MELTAMARPRKPNETRKSRVITFRITEKEFNELLSKAKLAGMCVNKIARIAALANADRIVVKTHARADPALIAKLHRIGHNLNQLVKNAHIFGRISPRVEELAGTIEEIIADAVDLET